MRRLAAILLGGLLLTLTSPTARAETSVRDGHCSDEISVTVVVDFQQLGGGTVVRCVSGLGADSTGYDAMVAAGFGLQGTVKDGEDFVCRIDGKPAPDQDIDVAGRPGFRERCVQTPPAEAFWSYWHSPNGGQWTFSQFGIRNRTVIPGGYEGWSFSFNKDEHENPRPRVSPSHPVRTPTVPAESTPTGSAPTASPKSEGTRPARTRQPAPSTTAAAPSPSRNPDRPRGDTHADAAGPTATPDSTASASPGDPASALASDAGPSQSATSAPSAVDEGTTASAASGPSPSAVSAPPVPAELVADDPSGTLIGVGAVAGVAATAGVVWWRRRR